MDDQAEFDNLGIEQKPLVDLIQELNESIYMKAVVSSREEPIFIDRLSSYRSLCLQDLTMKDIILYVSCRLLQESRMISWKVSQDSQVRLTRWQG